MSDHSIHRPLEGRQSVPRTKVRCTCGRWMIVRENHATGEEFLGSTRYGSVVKLQGAPQALATPTGPYTTSPAREIVMPAKRTTPSVPSRIGRPPKPLAERFWGQVRKTEGCWEWTGKPNSYGYGRISRNGDLSSEVGAHRLAYEWASGEPVPDELEVCHTCDVRHCVRNDEPGWYEVNGVLRPRFGHLWLGTVADNAADKAAKGRSLRGEMNPGAKLALHAVVSIRARYAEGGESFRGLAREFGVSDVTVRLIVHGKTWRGEGFAMGLCNGTKKLPEYLRLRMSGALELPGMEE